MSVSRQLFFHLRLKKSTSHYPSLNHVPAGARWRAYPESVAIRNPPSKHNNVYQQNIRFRTRIGKRVLWATSDVKSEWDWVTKTSIETVDSEFWIWLQEDIFWNFKFNVEWAYCENILVEWFREL